MEFMMFLKEHAGVLMAVNFICIPGGLLISMAIGPGSCNKKEAVALFFSIIYIVNGAFLLAQWLGGAFNYSGFNYWMLLVVGGGMAIWGGQLGCRYLGGEFSSRVQQV